MGIDNLLGQKPAWRKMEQYKSMTDSPLLHPNISSTSAVLQSNNSSKDAILNLIYLFARHELKPRRRLASTAEAAL